MTISRIIGGLGNQMFQYAAGRAAALKMSEPLLLDLSFFKGYGLHHGFELSKVFECTPRIASSDELRSVLGWRAPTLVQRILMKPGLSLLRGHKLIVEPHMHYWPGIKELPSNAYLAGYWQSERYFDDVSDSIHTDFRFRHPLAGRNAELAKMIDQTEAVSLHVRRGDYVLDPKTHAVLGVCSLDYYRAAIAHIAESVESPVFFVFSDDIAWARANLELAFPCTYVHHNMGSQSYNDMHLMSLCRHHIIANSSFSWWGAWLNPRGEKTVIAPKKWFANGDDAKDLLPEEWVAL